MATSVQSIVGHIAFDVSERSGKGPAILEVASGDFGALKGANTTVVTFNLQGFGNSRLEKDGKRDVTDLSLYNADFDAVIEAAGLSRPILFGYARAGYFAVKYATANSDAASGLILVEPALFTGKEDLLKRAEQAASGDSEASFRTTLRYISPSVGTDAQASAEAADHCLANVQSAQVLANEFLVRANNPVTQRDLAALRCPVLLIGGTESFVGDMINQAAGGIQNAHVWWVKGADILDLPSDQFAKEIGGAINLFVDSINEQAG